jgi:hypothetical protein
MAETANEAELGRSKHSSTPTEHLNHLLGLGWDPTSPLIQRFVQEHRLQRELAEWEKLLEESERLRKPSAKVASGEKAEKKSSKK